MRLRFAICLLPVFILLLTLPSSCNLFVRENSEKQPLARVGDAWLYLEDLAPLLQEEMSPQDSTRFVTHYSNNWAVTQLLYSKAKINLPREKLETFDRLVREYQRDLYSTAYLEALVQKATDTVITPTQLRAYYEAEKENFTLHEKLVQLRFVALPPNFLDKETVEEKIKTWKAEDKIYLDSIAVQFKKAHFNDSVWVSASRVIEKIPLLTPLNEKQYLKPSHFFELSDSTVTYLGKITRVLNSHDTAPFEYIAPKIKQLIRNQRRLAYSKTLKADLLREAVKNHEFTRYE